MAAAGFSINTLTLLGIVLAIGLVVDDAIVVLENIYAKIENGHGADRGAAIAGTNEIFMAVDLDDDHARRRFSAAAVHGRACRAGCSASSA